MQTKNLLKFSITRIIFFLVVILFSALSLIVQNSYAKSAPTKQVGSQAPKKIINNKSVKVIQNIVALKLANPGLPIRLQIPKIKVDASLEQIGLTVDEAVDVPKGLVNAGWYDLGPRPGEIGSAVITGHYGVWKNGIPTVFNNLFKLQKGDKIYIKDEKGMTIAFVVRKIQKYNPNADATEIFTSSDNKAHLNLITCEGVWNKVAKSYPNRLVIFADRE